MYSGEDLKRFYVDTRASAALRDDNAYVLRQEQRALQGDGELCTQNANASAIT